jgi:hypothetical protein
MLTTLRNALKKLHIRKQDNEFIVTRKGFKSPAGKLYQPGELKIIKPYRFEGDSDPSDNAILYLVEANDGLLGYCIDGYGTHTNHTEDWYDRFVKRIPLFESNEQEIIDLKQR